MIHPRFLAVTCAGLLTLGFPAYAQDKAVAAATATEASTVRPDKARAHSALGEWNEAIAANAVSLTIQTDDFRAADSSVYAALQLAQDDKAKALLDSVLAAPPRRDQPVSKESASAAAALPARYALERMDWAGAAALPIPAGAIPQAEAIRRFARGLGMALSGNAAGARGEIEAMNDLRAVLQKNDEGYWADRIEEQVLTISAWVALAEGDRTEALKLMRAAADSEDAFSKKPLLDPPLYPMRELLAELLKEIGQIPLALQEFETTLKLYPNRYRALWGATLTAAASGQKQKAFDYIDRFVAMTRSTDSPRPEIARARAFVAKR